MPSACGLTSGRMPRGFGGVPVRAHLMVHLALPPDETFEQMVCCCHPCWNATSLADVRASAASIAQELLQAPAHHPWPCAAYTLPCAPFFDDTDACVQDVSARVQQLAAAVAMAADATDAATPITT